MGILIDSSVFTEARRGRLELAAWVQGRAGEKAFVSVISLSELFFNAYRAATETERARWMAVGEALQATFTVLQIDADVAGTHAQLTADLAERGTVMPPHDLWLAATCLAYGLTMVTVSVREFRRVPGLVVHAPA